MRCCTRLIMFLSLLMPLSGALHAEPVRQEYLGLEVVGNLELAPNRTLEQHGVVLIVHGTLAHHRTEIVERLQVNLKQHGVNSLAITLSLGLNARKGMFDCKLEHDHRHADASDEIVAWVEWLQKKGATRVSVLGHSRGAAQVALALVERADLGVGRLVLAAPLMPSTPDIAARYARDTGQPLQPLLDKAHALVESGDGDSLMDVPGFLYCRPAKVTAAAFHDYYAPDPHQNALTLAQGVGVPTLIVAAGGDKIAPGVPEAVTGMHKSGSLPKSVSLTTIADADHMFMDLFGDELADMVAAFISAW